MKRIQTTPRNNWEEIAIAEGFAFYKDYWDESVYYTFTLDEIENKIEIPTQIIQNMTTVVMEYIIRSDERMLKVGVPLAYINAVRESWDRNDPSIYGRMDLAWNDGNVKLLEYNADTPTTLWESGVYQWLWHEDVTPSEDQFNSIHDELINRFRELFSGKHLNFACMPHEFDDRYTVEYLMHLANQGGAFTMFNDINDIVSTPEGYVNQKYNTKIKNIFKLYPWEWMFQESAGSFLTQKSETNWFEPLWKSVLTSKGFMVYMYELYPDHPNLLPTYFQEDYSNIPDDVKKNMVIKPLYSREGGYITIVNDGNIIESSDVANRPAWVSKNNIIQKQTKLFTEGANTTVIGSWIVGNRSCGIGLREQRDSIITKGTSFFVPHVIRG